MEALRFRPSSFFILNNATPADISGNGESVSLSATNKGVGLVSNTDVSRKFHATSTGTFDSDVYIKGKESKSFSVCATVYVMPSGTPGDVQIWSSSSDFDGLSFNGTTFSFSTIYDTTGEAAATFDVVEYGRYELVGVHTRVKNQLYVNAELVAEVDITDAQQADAYEYNGGTMTSGNTSSSFKFLMNNLGTFKHALTGDEIEVMYNDNLPKYETTTKSLSGTKLGITREHRPAYFSHLWDSLDDFNTGESTNVSVEDDQLVARGTNGVSIVGSWVTGTPFYTETDEPTLATVVVDWEGQNVLVQTSLDGVTWDDVSRSEPITTTGHNFDTTDKTLNLRVLFNSGFALEDCWLDWIRVEGYLTDTIVPTEGRTITLGYPSVVYDEHPWYELEDRWGIKTETSIAFAADTSDVPVAANTIEAWVKSPSGGAPTLSWTPTNTYQNGNFSSGSAAPNEWVLYHWVTTSAPANFTLTGEFTLGAIRVLDSTITSGQSQAIYKAYLNNPVTTVSDITIGLTESSPAAVAYGHDWAILTS